jgi:phosphoglycolate phosphatase
MRPTPAEQSGRVLKRPIAILFDIDGTLITTGGAGSVAWRRAFEELYGIPAEIGNEPEPRELARVMAIRLKYLPEAVADSKGYRVLDGVAELLPRLVDQGYLLGLTTGGTDSVAHIKLARANLARWFTFGGYGSDSTDRTELTRKAIERAGMLLGTEVDPDHVLVVGDTPLDIAAAHGADAIGVGVASGHFTVDQLKVAGADYALESLREPLPGVGQSV